MSKATASNPSGSCSSSNQQAVPLSISGAKPQGWPLRLPPLRRELECTRQPRKLREPNLFRLRWLLRSMTTTCKIACRRRRWRQWIPGAPRRCSIMFLGALGRKMPHQSLISSGASAGTSVASVSSRFRHHHVRACVGRAAWRVCR